MAVLSYETELGKTGTDEYLKLFYCRTLSEAVTGHPKYYGCFQYARLKVILFWYFLTRKLKCMQEMSDFKRGFFWGLGVALLIAVSSAIALGVSPRMVNELNTEELSLLIKDSLDDCELDIRRRIVCRPFVKTF